MRRQATTMPEIVPQTDTFTLRMAKTVLDASVNAQFKEEHCLVHLLNLYMCISAECKILIFPVSTSWRIFRMPLCSMVLQIAN